MDYDRELMKTRIEAVRDPIQRVLLQDVLTDVFSLVSEYSRDCYAALEEKLSKEIWDITDRYDVYTGVCRREDLDPVGRCLLEMETGMWEKNPHRLQTVFFDCDYRNIREKIGREFPARITTSSQVMDRTVTLKDSGYYEGAAGWLYEVFQTHQFPFSSLNFPYLHHFIDIVDLGEALIEEPILKIEVFLDGLERFLKSDVVPVWNIRRQYVQTEGTAIPGTGTVLYEHLFVPEYSQHGYLALLPEGEEGYCVVSEENIRVCTHSRRYDELELLEVVRPEFDKELTKLLYPVRSNGGELRLVDRQVRAGGHFPLTFANLERECSRYPEYESLSLEKVWISEEEEAGIRSLNTFLPLLQLSGGRRNLVLQFRPLRQTKTLFLDLAFLVSQLQFQTEEFVCVAKLRESL